MDVRLTEQEINGLIGRLHNLARMAVGNRLVSPDEKALNRRGYEELLSQIDGLMNSHDFTKGQADRVNRTRNFVESSGQRFENKRATRV